MQKKVISRAKFKTVCDVHLYNFSDKVKLFTDKINSSTNESITEERDFRVSIIVHCPNARNSLKNRLGCRSYYVNLIYMQIII